MKKNKIEAYKKSKNTNDEEMWPNFRDIRNKYGKMIKTASNNYIKNAMKQNVKETVKQCGDE